MDKKKAPHRALIITGGFCDRNKLRREDLDAELIIAADAGRLHARALGIRPHIIAGDFDSSPLPAPEEADEIVRVPAEKDDTDTMLACDIAIERGAAEIWILGGTGGRIDHSLSNIFLLENLRRRGVHALLWDGANRLRLLWAESVVLDHSPYRYFSLLALENAFVTLRGCKYPLTDASLCRALPYAVSNEITADAAEITVRRGPVLLIESEYTNPTGSHIL